jgi:hypothetical protein
VSKLLGCIAALVLTGAIASGALASGSALRTVAPSASQRAAILKAFGDPGAPARCLPVGLAVSDHAYATVRYRPRTGCARWGFDGVNVLQKQRSGRWKVLFEGSSYSCPRPRIPRAVQRDLGVCPR